MYSKYRLLLTGFITVSIIATSCVAAKIDYNYLKSNDFIIWSGQPLKWSDFKGRYGFTEYAAQIFWGISFMKSEEGKWNIFAHFNKRTSWYQMNSDHVLRHEQYHFNLTEVYARRLRKEVVTKKIMVGSPAFATIFNINMQECKDMQDRYDEETKHSVNQNQQTAWEQLIDTQLGSLNNYSSIVIE